MNIRDTKIESQQAAWLDAIVREVIKRLEVTPPSSASSNDRVSDEAIKNQGPNNQVELRQRVITLESLRGVEFANKAVVVPASAVVTPAVIDELRDKKAELVRDDGATVKTEVSSNLPCFVQGATAKIDPIQMGIGVELIDANQKCWTEIRSRVIAATEGKGAAIFVALEPYVASCELNRSEQLRVGYAATGTALGKLVQQLQPNVVVLDARRLTHAVIRGAAEELARQRQKKSTSTPDPQGAR